jgi:hypothetical protein
VMKNPHYHNLHACMQQKVFYGLVYWTIYSTDVVHMGLGSFVAFRDSCSVGNGTWIYTTHDLVVSSVISVYIS